MNAKPKWLAAQQWRLVVNLDHDGCVEVDFWRDDADPSEATEDGAEPQRYDVALYLADEDLAPMRHWRRFVNDMTTVTITDGWKIAIVKPEDTGSNGRVECDSWIFYMDVKRFLKILRNFRAMRRPAYGLGWMKPAHPLRRVEIDLKALAAPPPAPPLYTVTQLARHPNARGTIPATLAHFRRHITPERFRKLLADLSNYIDRAVIYGHRDEFYFDGRCMGRGLRFNGGFIRHGDDYSIHT